MVDNLCAHIKENANTKEIGSDQVKLMSTKR